MNRPVAASAAENSPNLTRTRLSCIILAKNEVDIIARCIRSAIDVADEVLVYDTGSTDGTQDRARLAGARVVERPWPGSHGMAKNASMQHAKYDWCLHLDADEIVSKELAQAIVDEMSQPVPEGLGFCMTRQAEFAGVAIPSLPRPGRRMDLVRIFHRRTGQFTHGLHETVTGLDQKQMLKGRLHHWRCFDLETRFEQANAYSTKEAEQSDAKGTRHSAFRLLLRPFARFVWHYFFDGSWRLGKVGLVHAQTMAMSEFMREAKLWERQRTAAPATTVSYTEDSSERDLG